MSRIRVHLTLAAVAVALLATPGAARATLVNNGGFETGSFSGWTLADSGPGAWEVYTGTTTPISGDPFPAPPEGTHAAVTEQSFISTQFLYQDVTLPPAGSKIQLNLFAYYTSFAPIVSPDSFSTGVENEQYRIDVMKPGVAIDSLVPGDILATVFRTMAGDPDTVGPTKKTADLSAFAGQTVRLRFAVVVTEATLNAGADGVVISGLTVGKPKPNDNGTAKLPVTVTDPGTVTLTGKGVKRRSAPASKSVSTNGGKVKLLVKPKGKTQSKLNQTGKASVKVTVTYTPNGGSPLTKKKKLKLKES